MNLLNQLGIDVVVHKESNSIGSSLLLCRNKQQMQACVKNNIEIYSSDLSWVLVLKVRLLLFMPVQSTYRSNQ